MRTRSALLLVAGLTLAAPASASAHGRASTVALDYRLVLDRSSLAAGAAVVRILDGDRAMRVGVHSGVVVIRGDLGEPMLRITPRGAWANRASATAVAEKIVSPGGGWKRVGGSSFVWHEHRLAPPPYADGRPGSVARFSIPALVNGRPLEIGGRFVRYPRPSIWPWVSAACLIAAVSAAGFRYRPAIRGPAVTGLGSAAGLAGLATLLVLGARDAPSGRVQWAQIAIAVALAAVLYGVLIRLHGVRRVQLAGIIGASAGVVGLGSVAVFRHGVVVSLLSPTASRALCAIALVAGVTSAAGSFTVEDVR